MREEPPCHICSDIEDVNQYSGFRIQDSECFETVTARSEATRLLSSIAFVAFVAFRFIKS